MIRVSHIEIQNVRSIDSLRISPEQTGVTAIVGPIGSGKSTVLDAMTWCLYGETPRGLTQSDMRRTGADDKPCEVSVTFTIDDAQITAQRRLRRSVRKGVPCESASASLWINGVAQPNITPTTLTQTMVNLTGLTGRAFTGAFYVPQGQLEALAEGSPGDVQRLFEEQTGLHALSRRIQSAGDLVKEKRWQMDALPGDPEQVRVAEQNAAEADREASELERSATVARSCAETSRTTWNQAYAHAEALVDQERAASLARERLARAEATLDAARGTLACAELAVTSKGVDASADGATLQQLRHSARAEEQRVTEAGQLLATALTISVQAQNDLSTARRQADTLGDTSTLATAVNGARNQFAAATEALAAARAQHTMLQTEYRRVSKAIITLEDDANAGRGGPSCPTCQQVIPHLGTVVEVLHRQQQQITHDGAAASAAVTAAHNDAAAAEKTLDSAVLALRGRETADHTVRVNDARVKQARADAEAAHRALAAVLAMEPDIEADTLLAAGRSRVEDLRRQQHDLDSALHCLAELHKAHTALTRAEHNQASAHQNLVDAPDPGNVDVARTAAQTLRECYDEAAATASEAEGLARAARLGAEQLAESAETARAQLARKQQAMTALEESRHAREIIVALRADLLSEYTTSVSAAATDILTQLGGEHVAFTIDEQFVPRVQLMDGTLRPTRVLSGGEKARAALCFRLGVAAQITGGHSPGMIFADEITAAQDPETRQAVIGLLRDLGLPVVIVSHTPEVEDIANHVVRLTKQDGTTALLDDASAAVTV